MRQFLTVAALLTVLGIPAAYFSADWNGKLVTHVASAPAAIMEAGDEKVANVVDWLAKGVSGFEAGPGFDGGIVGSDAGKSQFQTVRPAPAAEAAVSAPTAPRRAPPANAVADGSLLTRGVDGIAAGAAPARRAGIERGRAAAFTFASYKLAIDPENPAALYALARYYRDGSEAAERTAEQTANAVRYMLEAAKAGEMNAARDLGGMYRDGIGIAVNPVFAYAWLTVATLGMTDAADRDATRAERDDMAATMTADDVILGERKVAAYAQNHAALDDASAGLVLVGG